MVIGWFNFGGSADVFDVDYIQHMNGFDKVVKTLPPEIETKEPVQVDCSKRKGRFFFSLIFFCLLISFICKSCSESSLLQGLSTFVWSPIWLHIAAYSQCQYHGLSPASVKAIGAAVALVERKPGT